MAKYKKSICIILFILMMIPMIPSNALAVGDYWGFADYDIIEQKGAPEEITSYPTTIKKVSENCYTMSSTIQGVGIISISLIEEAWGTFNLGNWILTDTEGQKHTFVDASTDMEYVHRYYYNDSVSTQSGGNHGGEALVSIEIYDGESGEKILLSVGESKTANVIHVIEKTKLLMFPDANGDSINDYNNKSMTYTEDQVYAELTRKYTFTGPQIKLNVDYLYKQDIYHGRIMACMFPVNKKYSDYCDMYDPNGNFIKTVESRPYGDKSISDYTGSENSGNSASRAVIYSKNYPNYQFDIRVNTVNDSLNNFENGNYKTAYWDMNSTANKLYFSRYDHSKKILHEKGKTVNTEAIWLFKYSEDAREPNKGYEGDYDTQGNIAFGKKYIGNGYSGQNSYTADLTDGKASNTLSFDNNWFGFYSGSSANANTENAVGTVVIDLEDVYNIDCVKINTFVGANSGIAKPKNIRVLVSDNIDGEYKEFGKITYEATSNDVAWAKLEDTASGRFVKIEITVNKDIGAVLAIINEVAVFGTEKRDSDISDENNSENTNSEDNDNSDDNTSEPVHIHQETGDWKFDHNNHWKNCSCGEVISKSEHGFQGNKCIDCGYENNDPDTSDENNSEDINNEDTNSEDNGNSDDNTSEPVHIHQEADEWEYDNNNHWKNCSCGEVISESEHSFQGNKCIDCRYEKSEEVPELEYSGLRGDITLDGVIGMTDYILLKRAYFGTYTLNDKQKMHGDLNEDGSVGMTDYILLKRVYFNTYKLKNPQVYI